MTQITSTIDLNAEGRHSGYLRLPHSSHRSAYGWLPIPVATVVNGEGPTALLLGGNHGDEYEGQIALSCLARELPLDEISGRVILLPRLNAPAADVGSRVSPIDQCNLNRSFPGNPLGTPTAMIADYVENHLLPLADFAVDVHSGGSSLDYSCPAMVVRWDRKRPRAELDRLLEFAAPFGAPLAYVQSVVGDYGVSLLSAAARRGVPAVGTELGGGGRTSREMVELARAGLLRVLKANGVYHGETEPAAATTRPLHVGGPGYHIYADDSGIFEPWARPGEAVAAAAPVGRLHFPETPMREPVLLTAPIDGVVLACRVPCPSQRGDCLYQIGVDLEDEAA